MPPGSLGRVFYDAMNVPGGIPGYMLAGLIYRDGFFDGYDMPDDARYAIERTRWLHDLYHVLTGYGTDLAGEGLLIYFQIAYRQPTGFWRAALSANGLGPLLFLRPHVGQRRWRDLLREAHERGTAAREQQPPMYVYWEELLPRPLADVREELGIVPFEEDTSDWLSQSWLGRRAATGFGGYGREAEQAQLARRIVEAGVDFRKLMRATPERAAALRRQECQKIFARCLPGGVSPYGRQAAFSEKNVGTCRAWRSDPSCGRNLGSNGIGISGRVYWPAQGDWTSGNVFNGRRGENS
jgi:Coenzyme Q (ubiquinone) biosynthesis protein Coq4